MTEIEEAIAKGKCPICELPISEHKPTYYNHPTIPLYFDWCNSAGETMCRVRGDSPLARAMGLMKEKEES